MFRKQGLRVGAAVCCAAAFLAYPATAGTGGPGAPGAGDPYFPGYGNGGYDVSHYDVAVRYNPADDHLQGTTTIVAKPTQNLTSLNLDFALPVKSVRVNGAPARIDHQGLELKVTPMEPLAKDSLATVVVDYAGVPSQTKVNGNSAWIRTSDGAIAAGQPEISAWWFPSNDHPRDKATFDIAVQVPDGTQVLSNGVNTAKDSVGGWTNWQWRTTKPTATYLAFMTAGQYEISTKTGAFGQPFVTAYSKNLGDKEGAAKASVERTPEVLDFLSGLFGPYPFEAQGGVATGEGMGFALEDQTRPTYSDKFFKDGPNMSVIVHENAHQWFGDSVSLDTWRHIWINEGFASYAEWLWAEHAGTNTAQELFDHYYSSKPADDPFWQVKPGDPGKDNVFDTAVYDRGAMTLHALRNVIGEAALTDTVQTWTAEKRYGNGTVEEFIRLAEEKSGKDLGEFFQTWLFTAAKPPVGAQFGVPASAAHHTASVPEAAKEIDATHAIVHSQHHD